LEILRATYRWSLEVTDTEAASDRYWNLRATDTGAYKPQILELRATNSYCFEPQIPELQGPDTGASGALLSQSIIDSHNW